MVRTAIDPEKPVSDPRGGGQRDDGHEEILQADSDRYKCRIIGMNECKRCGDHTSWWVQANYPTYSVHVAMTKSQWFDESKQSSSNCKKAMHDLDGASDQDIMFGDARDETIAYSLSTSIGQDLTDSHKNSDVRRLQLECKTRSTITWNRREGNSSDRFEKYEQHACRERVVRLIEDILADSRVTADDNVQTMQSTDTDFNKLVCNQTIRTEWRGCVEPWKLSVAGKASQPPHSLDDMVNSTVA